MKIKILLIFFLISSLVKVSYSQEIKEAIKGVIDETFPEEVNFKVEKYSIPDTIRKEIEFSVKQKFFKDYVYLYRIYLNDKIIAIAFLDNVYGKSMPITFLIIFDIDGIIISTRVIKYREPYGGAVQNKGWNEQFTGKDSKSDFTVGESVSGISGATISVNSLTKGIKKITLLFERIKNKI